MSDYAAFIERKSQLGAASGFAPVFRDAMLFDFQEALVDWSVRMGRAAVFADCGMGKTAVQLVWAQNVVQHTNGRVLILAPLAVGPQTVQEGGKFGVPCVRSRDGSVPSGAGIVVTNYEKLHLFSASDFTGVVCDESSILKHFKGATQQYVTRFMAKVPYRHLCTATAAPNDYVELGTSSEALGGLGQLDMLQRFFKQEEKVTEIARMKSGVKRQSANVVAGTGGGWRLKGHAVTPFWQWVASWARACRKPSDLGFDDGRFVLPELIEREHIVTPLKPSDGMLFQAPAVGLREERAERRRSMKERCDLVAQLVDHPEPAVVWCHLNEEGDALARTIPGSVQVKGANTDDEKEEAYRRFASGDVRVLIIKPKIGAWGLNWQHCAHVVTFASHSYEQYYQSVRRCWRFGQTRPVVVDVVSTEGEQHIRENMARKASAADVMFSELVQHMNTSMRIHRERRDIHAMELPVWLS